MHRSLDLLRPSLLPVALTAMVATVGLAPTSADAATPKVCAQADAARLDACKIATAFVAGAAAPGLSSNASATVLTSHYKIVSGTGYRSTTWGGTVSKATINAAAQPTARSVPTALIYDRGSSRYLIPSAVFNQLAQGQASTAPTITVQVNSPAIAANATTFKLGLEYTAKANKAGSRSTDGYAMFTVPLRKTFTVNATATYCGNFDTINLSCQSGVSHGPVTLRRTAISATSSTLYLIWTSPSNTAKRVTIKVVYAVASNGDLRVTSTSSG